MPEKRAALLNLTSVTETALFRKLEQPAPGRGKRSPVSTGSAVSPDNIETLCREASERMKYMPALHPQFTLHDAAHLLRVTGLMGLVLGDDLAGLNAVEIALLILAAHFHDQGMVPEESERMAIEKADDFQMHRELWRIEHPNLKEIEAQLAGADLDDGQRRALALKIAELEGAIWSDYLRKTHGERSAELVVDKFGNDKRLEVAGVSIAEALAALCKSHVQDPHDLTALPMDKLIGTHFVNLRYLAVVLRLADVLDFDRERTPQALYRTIHFTSDVSIAEWEKHRAVLGWAIEPNLVRFEMEFEHPIYERSARQFLDYIDAELAAAHDLINEFPAKFSRYKLHLPSRVDRSRIGPQNGAYVYHDLEFSLSRDEIVKLLMTDKLYGAPSLCVRELLQNSLDALRYRNALFRSAGAGWTQGKVEFEHGVDAYGHEFLRCRDNGVGMDEKVITSFLTRVGRSFYRSPFFEQERMRFRQAGVDFDPCSQFGIGFMSCFMLGDRIRIETRRDYGVGTENGKPWIVEINGLGSIVTLRPGPKGQPVGTTVAITSRRKPEGLTREDDPIKLVATLKDYARAVEYPIDANCTVTEIADSVHIDAGLSRPRTFLEEMGIKKLLRIDREVSALDASGMITGIVSESFLADGRGNPVLANDEAAWERYQFGNASGERVESLPVDITGSFRIRILRSGAAQDPSRAGAAPQNIVCADGIRVASGSEGYSYSSGVQPAWLIDTRGGKKPQLTPAREAISGSRSLRHVDELRRRALGMIWEEIAAYLPDRLTHENWWKLVKVYSADVMALPAGLIWNGMQLPVAKDGAREFMRFCDIGGASFQEFSPGVDVYRLIVHSGGVIDVEQIFLVIGFSELRLDNGGLRLDVLPPASPGEPLLRQFIGGLQTYVVPFRGGLEKALCSRFGATLINREHPLILFHKTQDRGKVHEFLMSLFFSDPFIPAGDLPAYKLKHRREAGGKYASIQWHKMDPALRPPYKMYSELQGWSDLTDEELRSFADIPVPNDD